MNVNAQSSRHFSPRMAEVAHVKFWWPAYHSISMGLRIVTSQYIDERYSWRFRRDMICFSKHEWITLELGASLLQTRVSGYLPNARLNRSGHMNNFPAWFDSELSESPSHRILSCDHNAKSNPPMAREATPLPILLLSLRFFPCNRIGGMCTEALLYLLPSPTRMKYRELYVMPSWKFRLDEVLRSLLTPA